MNVDKTNIEYIPKLLHMLRDDHLNNRIGIGFGRTWSYGLCEYTWAFSAEEFGKYFVPLMKLAIENEFKLLSVKIPFNILGCGAYTINTLIVDPLGNLYKCWDLLGDPRYSVGNIDNGINISKHAEWILRSPSKSEACKKCSFLPACGGGCAALSIREGKSLKDFTCIDVKYFIKEWLKLYLYLSNLLDDKLLSF
ncbi:MAG: SPASM domain-containing protein [Candidatus Bathyarchaeia archaeon]